MFYFVLIRIFLNKSREKHMTLQMERNKVYKLENLM